MAKKDQQSTPSESRSPENNGSENNSSENNGAENPGGETFPFQTEMQQLLHILVHSLYSEREVFLRELISNASDAINRLKFHILTDPKVRDAEAELEIVLEVDVEGKALVISDSGIGMTREDMISNLGTIARSGTLEFVKQLSAAEPGQRMDLIGQFGVGFYSVFMVAKRVIVDSCPAQPEAEPSRWVSEGHGEFSLLPGERTTRGTTVRIELKEEGDEFANVARVEGIVKRYSNFIPHPIRLDSRRINIQEAIWTLPKSQVKEDQYAEFYKFLSHGNEDPLRTIHLSIDAPVQYQALLYLPRELTNEVLYSPKGFGLELYANKVMIQRDSQDLLPLYLRFFRGVVDTQDLPLNVSRETVQNNPLVARLRKSLTGRVLRDLAAMAEKEAEAYKTFWLQYGKVLKEGISADPDNKERLLELTRFNSSACEGPDDLITLKDYVARIPDGQQEILYFTGPSREAIENHPQMEVFRKKKLEVLYLYDQVDDFVMAGLFEYEGKKFASIDSPDLDALKEEEAVSHAEAVEGEALEGLLGFFKDTLGDGVSDVKVSRRLVDSPALLVSADGIPGNLQKMMRMMNQDFQSTPKILEINPAHAMIRGMAAMREAHPKDTALTELVEQIYDNCLLLEGLIEHPERMVLRIQSLMTRAATVIPSGESPMPAGESLPPSEASNTPNGETGAKTKATDGKPRKKKKSQ